MSKALLEQQVLQLEKQASWLSHSFNEAKKIGIKQGYSLSGYDVFENFSSRYVRTIDFVVRKIFRLIDTVELEAQGSLIDVVNRADKRGLLVDIAAFRQMKDLRNAVAHEYIDDQLERLFEELLQWAPVLLNIVSKTGDYIKQLLPKL